MRCLRARKLPYDQDTGFGLWRTPEKPFNADEFYGVDELDNMEGKIKSADQIIESIPLVVAIFDFVAAFDFAEHIPRVTCRVLMPGGMFLSMTLAYSHAVAIRLPTNVNTVMDETLPTHFDDDKRHGFRGAFSIRVLSGADRMFYRDAKLPVPALSHDDLLKQKGVYTYPGPVM